MSKPTLILAPLAAALLSSLSPAASAAQADGTAEKDATKLDTIEVHGMRPEGYGALRTGSATRTDTALHDVPQAITVVTEAQLRDRAVQGMTDAVRYVPGIGITQGEGNRDGLVFRGNSSTADFFVDGMRDDVQYYRDTYNIERIEALKGPNAMIFGRGSPGGLLNRVTKVADWRENRALDLQLGAWNKRRASNDLDYVLGDSAALRLTGVYERSGSYRNGFRLDRTGINPTLALRAGERTRAVFGYEYFSDKRTADRGVPSYALTSAGTRYPFATDPSTFFGDPDASRASARVHALQGLVEHDFGGGAVLRNRTRLADYDKSYRNVYPGNVDAAAVNVGLQAYDNATRRKNVFNQTDLIVSRRFGSIGHTFLFGTEFGRQRSENLRESGNFVLGGGSPCLAGSSAATCLVPLRAPTVAPQVIYRNNSAGGSGDAHNRGNATVAALYVQDQIEFSPQWQLTLGLRYDRFDLDFTDLRNGVRADRRALSSSDRLWSPRAGLVYQPAEALSLYASYGITYLPRSGEQLGSLAFNNQTLAPEKFKNVELGAKWNLRDDLTAEAALYRLNRSNAAIADPADPNRLILLGGDSQRIDGVEFSLSGRITERLQTIASYAWQDARTLQPVGTVPKGRTLAQTPEHALGLWNRFDLDARWGFGLGATYRSASFATISNAVTLRAYTRFDAAVYYTFDERLSAQVNIENLFDKTYFPSAHTDNNITPGAPRGAYLSVRYKF